MNTVGKPGRLGEQIKCVVSVSMLTEGWDANTVTHVLGIRAFSTQLLCEQVVGRALRRTTYVTDENDMFPAEYAEVYGVPFSFIPVGSRSGKRWRYSALNSSISRATIFLKSGLSCSPDSSCTESMRMVLGRSVH